MLVKIVTACGLCETCYQLDLGNFMFPEMYSYVSLTFDLIEMLSR